MKTLFKFLFTVFFTLSINSCDTSPPSTPKFEMLSKEKIIKDFRESSSYPYVLDAAISEEPGKISIVIIINNRVSENQAKDALDSLTRRVITFSDDSGKPSKEIGETTYDYIVGAYTPDEKKVVLGAKVSVARKITW